MTLTTERGTEVPAPRSTHHALCGETFPDYRPTWDHIRARHPEVSRAEMTSHIAEVAPPARAAGMFSARREYLRVTRSAQTLDICAAPFGSGFFFSW